MACRSSSRRPTASTPGPREHERYRREFGILQRLRDVRGVTRAHALRAASTTARCSLLEEVRGRAPVRAHRASRFEVLRVPGAGHLPGLDAGGAPPPRRHPQGHQALQHHPHALGRARASSTSAPPASSASSTWTRRPPRLIEGTLAYMSPEQTGRMNRSVDYRTDLYSLGVTLYELLTGSAPLPRARRARVVPRPHGAGAPAAARAGAGAAARPVRHRPEAAGQGGRGALPERRGAEGRPGALPRGACAGACTRTSCSGVHDMPHRFQLPQRLYGRDAQAATLLQGFERVARERPARAHPGAAATRASASPRWCTSCTSRWCGSAASSSAASSISSSGTSPTPPWPRPSAGWRSSCWRAPTRSWRAWREHLREAWEGQGQVLVDLVPQLELVAGKQPARPGAAARRGAAPLQPRVPPVPRRVRHPRAPARGVPG